MRLSIPLAHKDEKLTYPAKDPPTHDIVAGVNAGAFPAFEMGGGGDGLFNMVKYGSNGHNGAYRSYGAGRGRSRRLGGREEAEAGNVDIARTSSAWSLVIKPGNMGVPPTTRIVDARAFRRSTGTWYAARGGLSPCCIRA